MSEQFKSMRGEAGLAILFKREKTHQLPDDYGLAYDYRRAAGRAGPLASEWVDKPHRIVYDLLQVVDIYRRQLDATEKERDEARLATSLMCDLHGCASEGCTAAQYHQDAQDMFAKLASVTEDRERLRAALQRQLDNVANLLAKDDGSLVDNQRRLSPAEPILTVVETCSPSERAIAATEQELAESAPVEDYIRELEDKPSTLTNYQKTQIYGNLRGFWAHLRGTAEKPKASQLQKFDEYISLHYPQVLVTAESPLPVLIEGGDRDLYTEASAEFNRTRPADIQYDTSVVREIWLRLRRERQLMKVLDDLAKATSAVNVRNSNMRYLGKLFGVSGDGLSYDAWKARWADFAQIEVLLQALIDSGEPFLQPEAARWDMTARQLMNPS